MPNYTIATKEHLSVEYWDAMVKSVKNSIENEVSRLGENYSDYVRTYCKEYDIVVNIRNIFKYWNAGNDDGRYRYYYYNSMTNIDINENTAYRLGVLANSCFYYINHAGDAPECTARRIVLNQLHNGVTIDDTSISFFDMMNAVEQERIKNEMERERQRLVSLQNKIQRDGRPTDDEGNKIHHKRTRKQLADAGVNVMTQEQYVSGDWDTAAAYVTNTEVVFKTKPLFGDDGVFDKAREQLRLIASTLYASGYKFTCHFYTNSNETVDVDFRLTGYRDALLNRDFVDPTENLLSRMDAYKEQRNGVTVG